MRAQSSSCDGDKIYAAIERHGDESLDFRRLFGAKVSIVGYQSPAKSNLRQTVKNVLVIDSKEMISVVEPPPNDDPFVVGDISDFDFLIHDNRRASLRQGVVGEADNGEDAVTAALRLRPDIVIMDLMMPKKDGIAHALEAGACGAIIKTADDNALITAILNKIGASNRTEAVAIALQKQLLKI